MSEAAKTDPDSIFYEDELIAALTRRQHALLASLSQAVGEEISAALAPDRCEPHWPAAAKPIFEEYSKVAAELERRNSRRCSQQLSRFLAGANGEQPMTEAMRRWWRNRY